MSDELLSHKINLIQDQIDNLERSGFFTEKEMDQATASLKMQLAILKEAKAFADFVVNCFQNCIFTYDSQQLQETGAIQLGCELLSELYFYL